MIDNYLTVLLSELENNKQHFSTIQTIYIGGGTPSILKTKQLRRIFNALSTIKPLEYTVELSPELYNDEMGKLFTEYGVNRISLSVQSFDNGLLKYINHKYDKLKIYDTVSKLKAININNISIDMLYGIPRQTLELLYNDLNEVDKLNINHVSYYNLVLEENTYFYNEYESGNYEPLSNDLEGCMFDLINNKLEEYGFKHYEITNYCRDNKESAHNKIYWQLDEYIGIGLGAHSFHNKIRSYNYKDFNNYIRFQQESSVLQTDEELLQDKLIMGLHLLKGVNINELESIYKIKLLDKFPELIIKINEGLVKVNLDYLVLSKKGIKLANEVLEVFVWNI